MKLCAIIAVVVAASACETSRDPVAPIASLNKDVLVPIVIPGFVAPVTFPMKQSIDPKAALPTSSIMLQSIGNTTLKLPSALFFKDSGGVLRFIPDVGAHTDGYRQIDVRIEHTSFVVSGPVGPVYSGGFTASAEQKPWPKNSDVLVTWSLITTVPGSKTQWLGYYPVNATMGVQWCLWYPKIDVSQPLNASTKYCFDLGYGDTTIGGGDGGFTIIAPLIIGAGVGLVR